MWVILESKLCAQRQSLGSTYVISHQPDHGILYPVFSDRETQWCIGKQITCPGPHSQWVETCASRRVAQAMQLVLPHLSFDLRGETLLQPRPVQHTYPEQQNNQEGLEHHVQ